MYLYVAYTSEDRLGEFGERYMEHAKTNKRSWLRDEQMLNPLCEFFGKGRPLTDVAHAQIESYKIQRQGKIADSTVNRELALLKRMFNLGITWICTYDRIRFERLNSFEKLPTGSAS